VVYGRYKPQRLECQQFRRKVGPLFFPIHSVNIAVSLKAYTCYCRPIRATGLLFGDVRDKKSSKIREIIMQRGKQRVSAIKEPSP